MTGLGWIALALAGCGGRGSPIAGGGLTLGLTDGPVDEADAVVVSFSAVELLDAHGEVAERVSFSPSRSIDLLAQQGGAQDLLLDNRDVAPGTYPKIRLVVDGQTNASCKKAQSDPNPPAYITVDGTQYPLVIPGGGSSGLELTGPIEVVEGTTARYTIDFDLRKSIARRGSTGCYNMKPVLRLIHTDESGTVSGNIDPQLLIDSSCTSDPVTGQGAAVYVFAGADATPDDYDGDGVGSDPVTTALLQPVTQDGNLVSFGYTAAFLPPGPYTVALSCQAGDDDPPPDSQSDDNVQFVQPANVIVPSGGTVDHDFIAIP